MASRPSLPQDAALTPSAATRTDTEQSPVRRLGDAPQHDTVRGPNDEPSPDGEARPKGLRDGGEHPRSRLRALRSLIKERIVLLVVAATALGYGAADAAPAGAGVLLAALLGTALLSAGSGVLNNVLEQEVDARMERTRRRALPRGAVSRSAAAWFGSGLTGAGTGLLWVGAGPLPALIGALAAALYLAVYTPMKRYSWLNTPLGAIPGALPPLIGWAAASGGLQTGAWILFATLFLWQHPHFYAIAWTYRDDYRRAGLKMATEVGTGGRFLIAQVVWFLVALIPVSMALTAVGAAGVGYAVGCLAIGTFYLAAGIRFARRRDTGAARGLLRTSVLYLPALLLIAVADSLLFVR